LNPGYEIEVINFESVHKAKIKPDIIVIDEAHSIGAYPKQNNRAKNLKKLAVNLPIIYLSGSPTPESHSQIYHQLWISSFSPFNQYINFYKWANDYVTLKHKFVFNRKVNDYSDANIDKIKAKTGHLFLSFTQKEAGFNFSIEEKILTVNLNEKQRKAIEILRRDYVLRTRDGNVILADTAVKLQSKIHQICSGSIKDENGNIHLISDEKAVFLKQYFKGKKIAIFYKFIGEFNVLKQVFEDEWTAIPEEFQASDKTFLGQFVSSREGIRLDSADAIVFYNIDFSYLSYVQAKDRIISKERKTKAILYWMFSNGGIEQKIYKCVKNKSDYTTHYFKRDYEFRKQSTIENYKKT
jgi:hypothetical protein